MCGDIWRGEMLHIASSGDAADPITFGSYPAGCANQPILSGAQPIAGWTQNSGEHLCRDMSAGANAANFPARTTAGINQLFRNGQRFAIWALAQSSTRQTVDTPRLLRSRRYQNKGHGLARRGEDSAGVHVRAFR